MATTDKCSFCNKPETVKHFFFSCTKFKEQQTALFASNLQVFPDFAKKSIENKLQALLYGIYLNAPEPDSRNRMIFFRVQNYILQTGRFSKSFKPGPFQPSPSSTSPFSPPLRCILGRREVYLQRSVEASCCHRLDFTHTTRLELCSCSCSSSYFSSLPFLLQGDPRHWTPDNLAKSQALYKIRHFQMSKS